MPTPVTEQSVSLVARDGRALSARLFAHPEARAGVVIHGATATPRRYYDRFARWLAGEGFRVLTYDYRGVGGSRGRSLRGDGARLRDWAELDAEAAVAWMRAHGGRDPLAMVGHSFGGQALGLSDAIHDVDAALMVGVQFGWVGHWPAAGRARIGAWWRLALPAAVAAFGYLPGWAGLREDLPAGVAREWALWCRSPQYLLDHVPEARARFARFASPVLFYSFTDDDFAPRAAVQHYLGALAGAAVTHRRLGPEALGGRPVGHFGFFRPDHANTLWPEAARWLDDALAGRPSRVRSTPEEYLAEDELVADLAFGRD